MKKNDNRKYSKEEIEIITESMVGKTFGEINKYKLKTYNKGSFGHIFEKDVFEYAINSDSEPDFIEAGIELKVTPYKKNKNNTLSAKERLVLNIIDFMTEYKNEFYTSHFWFKNKKLQIVWYLKEEGKKKENYRITHTKFLDLAKSDDLKQIIEDWKYIINKIKNGKAHEISEADTMYLGACTKGVKNQKPRQQPFSNILAKQRAFCFKQPYMTQLVRKYIGTYEDVEQILKNKNITFNEFVESIIKKFRGKTDIELKKLFKIETEAKNLHEILINKMFGVKGKLSKTDEFLKANIVPKTVRIEADGTIEQSMSFPAFKFTEILNEEWEDSEIRNTFETTKYIFFIFKNNGKDYVFSGIKLWNMPEKIIETNLKQMWEETKAVIASGNIVHHIDKRGKRYTNFPGQRKNKVCHVRPHGTNKDDTYPLPIKDTFTGSDKYTKHCFWLNNNYVKEILKDYLE